METDKAKNNFKYYNTMYLIIKQSSRVIRTPSDVIMVSSEL